MPLALLLGQIVKTIQKGAKQLTPWAIMAEMEELLINRARGAFMVHWFGPHLPLTGLHIQIAIVNLDALRTRYSEVLAEHNRRVTVGGPNLLGPLAGLSGAIAGIMVSPIGLQMLSIAFERHATAWWQGLLNMLNWLSGGLLGSALIAPLVAPLVALGALVALAVDPEGVRRLYNLLSVLAQLMQATTALIDQLLVPRDQVRNPLLRQILLVADNLSNVTMGIIGIFALLITRIGPLLAPLPAQLRALYLFIAPVREIFTLLWTDFRDRMVGLYKGPHAPYQTLWRNLRIFKSSLSDVGSMFGNLGFEIQSYFTWVWRNVKLAFTGGETDNQSLMGWLDIIMTELRTAFTQHPTVQVILRLIDVLTLALPHFQSDSSSSSSSGTTESIVNWLTRHGFLDPNLPTTSLPDFPALPSLPDADEIARRMRPPVPFSRGAITGFGILGFIPRAGDYLRTSRAIAASARRAIRSRPSYFAPERRRLRDELGRSPQTELDRLYQQQIPFRQALLDVVATFAAQAIPNLRDVLVDLDRSIYRQPSQAQVLEGQGALFPVRIVPTASRLRPEVGLLRVQAQGASREATDQWLSQLRQALTVHRYRVQSYPAQPATPGAP